MSHYLFILESIGTPELLLIAVIALIIFGPRKLPQIGRTIGKYSSEFKRASQDFRQTWEREVQMSEFEEATGTRETNLARLEQLAEEPSGAVENTVGRSSARRASAENTKEIAALNENGSVAMPEIRAATQEEFAGLRSTDSNNENNDAEFHIEESQPARRSKRDWL
jgi:sec-independent protein translocase protein TatA